VKTKIIAENTIAQFFIDSGFIPPKGRNVHDFDLGFGLDTGVEENMTLDGYDGIPDTITDISQDITDGSDHPPISIVGDYFMFNDPGTRNNPDLRTPPSDIANKTNVTYRKKDLSQVQSASDVHLEPLEQLAGEYPKHIQIRSQMEPSVFDIDATEPIDQSGLQPPQPGEVVLEQPTMFEGVMYPRGTRIYVESAIGMKEGDELFKNPRAKLCPLCKDPYVGDACNCVKLAQPGPDAIRVNEKRTK